MSGRRTVRIRARVQEASRPATMDEAWLKDSFAHGIVVDVRHLKVESDTMSAEIDVDISGLPQAAVLLEHSDAQALWHKTIEAQFVGGWCDVVGDADGS